VIAAQRAIVSEASKGKSQNQWLRNGRLWRKAVVQSNADVGNPAVKEIISERLDAIPCNVKDVELDHDAKARHKFLGTQICVSAAVADATKGFQGRPVGDLMLRGRSEPLRAFEPLSAESFERPAKAQYCEAFAKLEAGDGAAMPAFAALVGLHADDALASYHLRRLLNGAKGVRIQLEQ